MLRWYALLALVCTSVGFAVASLVMPAGGLIVNADCRGNCPAEPGTPCGNGDVNADGGIDITDGIYILNFLFLGGPAPVAIECVPSGALGLPDTGQTLCYDESGNEVDCMSATCAGQDGRYATGCPSEGRFIDNGDGTVTDNCTDLTWMQATADVHEDGLINANDALPWCDAITYCDNLDFAEHNDWRLPNVHELQSIADYGRCPAFDPTVFSIALPGEGWFVWYWSSTSPANDAERGKAWNVYFWNGFTWADPKSYLGYVLAVRG